MQSSYAHGEIVTGLLYVEADATDLHESLGTTSVPLNQLGEKELCPGSAARRNSTPACAEGRPVTAVDLRSDTVTRPSPAMREAMARAVVGDDVFGDDPTVQALEARAAELFGLEAGLFFPTGTQSNLSALMAHCGRGEEVIVGQDAHTYRYEGGGAAVLGSIQPQPLANLPDGTLDLAMVEAAVKPDDSHFAITRLLALENTIGGKVIGRDYVAKAVTLAWKKGLSTPSPEESFPDPPPPGRGSNPITSRS